MTRGPASPMSITVLALALNLRADVRAGEPRPDVKSGRVGRRRVDLVNGIPVLTATEAYVIGRVKNGADIYDYALAGVLRRVQRQGGVLARCIDICEPQMYRGDGTGTVPYFGCIATPLGKAAVRAFQRTQKRESLYA